MAICDDDNIKCLIGTDFVTGKPVNGPSGVLWLGSTKRSMFKQFRFHYMCENGSFPCCELLFFPPEEPEVNQEGNTVTDTCLVLYGIWSTSQRFTIVSLRHKSLPETANAGNASGGNIIDLSYNDVNKFDWLDIFPELIKFRETSRIRI